MKILAIESSCDETSAAVVENGTVLLSNIVTSSSSIFEKFGGIVPELAAREQLKYINPVIGESLKKANVFINEIDAIAVTNGPGLIGSILVGVETAKTLSFLHKKPIIPVNHVLAHPYANFLSGNSVEFPAVSLVASGGHTELFLMTSMKDIKWLGGTLDDAAGECFDKAARLIGLGHGGGMAIQKLAQQSKVVKLPRPLMYDDTLNFSFSGLKTAIMREWAKHPDQAGFAYEVQESITDVLVKKTIRAAEIYNANTILLSGGVAANSRLREKFSLHTTLYTIHSPPVAFCTDNAAYIGSYAYFRGIPTDWHDINAIPDLSVEV